jgi:hypothetical protein
MKIAKSPKSIFYISNFIICIYEDGSMTQSGLCTSDFINKIKHLEFYLMGNLLQTETQLIQYNIEIDEKSVATIMKYVIFDVVERFVPPQEIMISWGT